MDVSGGLSLVQFVIEKLGSPIWTQIEAVLGLESELDKLRDTMSTIEAVLLDAEVVERLHQGCRTYVELNKLKRLKEALYRADDLLDEITTLAHLKKLMPCNNNRVCNEVCLFFSRSNQFRSASNWSREMKMISEMLDRIVIDHRYVTGSAGSDAANQMRINARETHSHVGEDDVFVGRKKDKRKVIDMLLNNTVEQQDGLVVSIVGIGGLGKTTLAQQLYNDKMIVEKFPQRKWVCVSDTFDVKVIVGQILAAVNSGINQDNLNLDLLQMKLRQEMHGNKYFLVLDDVWIQEPSKWDELRNVLIGGERVSRILVTTRSRMVADVVGSHHWTHELEGLSDDESLDLFKKMALKPEENPVKQQLVDIGKVIVRKCANVPLAIRVVGSLLRGQDESKWESLKNTDLANIVQDESNGIIPVLKMSYNYLPFHLKSCFSYCAIFPKDYKIIKEDLICLWMAQGFIMPSDGESFEDVGEEYFKQLLQRCFFQDVERIGGTKEIKSCKMHDLIHDLAKEVAGTDILSCTYSPRRFNEKTRHVFIDRSTPKDVVGKLSNMQRMRTFLCTEYRVFSLKPFLGGVSKVKYLRVLRLNHCYGLKELPSGIGELVHLRYLDLSGNDDLCVLPSSITKLYNLQTLKLCGCRVLKILPRELRKLVNLRHLDISGCSSLTCMPPGMNSMASLRNLRGFVVREMDVPGGLSMVQTILQLLNSAVWKETESVLGVKFQLHKHKKTMSTIDAILRDAEEQEWQHLSHSRRDRLERLKEALYQADDLFDEVTTLARRKKLMPGNNLSKEVSLFFSRFNQLRSAFIWSREIKSIRERLDDVVKDHHDAVKDHHDAVKDHHDVVKDHQLAGGFRHSVVFEDSRVRNNPRETHSYVNLENDVIIGRNDDKRFLIDMLLDTTVEGNVSVVSIVGIGGLGKTTLAQLVYNDDKIQKEFPLKMWVCVSDNFNVKALAGQILAAATNQANQSDGLTMDQLQIKLREVLDKNKYLLVLDDVWNENFEEWRKLKTLLVGGGKGSRILVTTRSKHVAVVVGSRWAHELKGLSDEDSWNLFQRMTLESGQHQIEANLVDIGKEIVRKCANVPLVIRVVGSLLRGQDESKWQNLINNDLANIIQDEANGIVPVLKISYNYLPFHLKICFSYCAVFPKDYKIIKKDLICLWMAQGFIMPSDGESFEDAGDKYFKQLLQRCFFQDVELAEGTTNDIISCKMHDLIHDLAKEVAGTDILSYTYSTRCFNVKTRHVIIDRSTPKDVVGKLSNMQRMRTFLCTEDLDFSLKPFLGGVSKVKYLRVLRLNHFYGLKELPSGIGELVHLRYLDLSYNSYLCVLPSSITKLYNLQTLKLRGCGDLKRLPRELRKLVNLRHLDISGCWSLTCMPPGMNSMASLRNLTGFVVSGSATSNAVWGWRSTDVGQLEDLDEFTNYTRTMEIVVRKNVRYDAVGGGMLLKSLKLWEILYAWETEEIYNAEVMLQGLQPHSNLRELELRFYPGAGLPTWMMTLICCLPNLAEIEIDYCKRLEHLPLMSQLRHLKVLKLKGLSEVEYMESSSINSGDDDELQGVEYMESSSNNSGDDDELVFFPSLEKLELENMPKLKGWWKSSSESEESETPQAPKLSRLFIKGCPELTTFPLCPGLQELYLRDFNEALGPIMRETTHGLSVSNNNHEEDQGRQGRLREVETNNVRYLTSLPIHSFHYLSYLRITNDQKMKELKTEEVFRSGRLSSLRSLVIECCCNLKSISGRGVWDQFTGLESLILLSLPELELEDEGTGEGCIEMPWRYLAPTLRYLKLGGLLKMVKLPKGIGCLSSLHSLEIENCDNLESLTPSIGVLSSLHSLTIKSCSKLKRMPEEMRHLTSLTKLRIWGCSPELADECENQTGANWSNIQHIPDIQLGYI